MYMSETVDKEQMKEEIWKEVSTVMDPDLKMSLVELGLIYELELDDDMNVKIRMTLTSMGCPIGPYLMNSVGEAAKRVEGVNEADVQIVWEPRWDPREMASEEAQLKLGIL
jgi:metal-sulfur cluster biosynthetic enzyme